MPQTVYLNLQNIRVVSSAPSGQPSYDETWGKANSPPGCITLSNGTGYGQANQCYRGNDAGQLVVPAGGSITIDLKGTHGEVDNLNKPLSLATVKFVYLELATPGAGNSIRIGPDGNANNANLGFAASGNQTFDSFYCVANATGWPIGSNSNVTIKNPSAADQVIYPRIAGTAA